MWWGGCHVMCLEWSKHSQPNVILLCNMIRANNSSNNAYMSKLFSALTHAHIPFNANIVVIEQLKHTLCPEHPITIYHTCPWSAVMSKDTSISGGVLMRWSSDDLDGENSLREIYTVHLSMCPYKFIFCTRTSCIYNTLLENIFLWLSKTTFFLQIFFQVKCGLSCPPIYIFARVIDVPAIVPWLASWLHGV